jgi:hypothetical protein
MRISIVLAAIAMAIGTGSQGDDRSKGPRRKFPDQHGQMAGVLMLMISKFERFSDIGRLTYLHRHHLAWKHQAQELF